MQPKLVSKIIKRLKPKSIEERLINIRKLEKNIGYKKKPKSPIYSKEVPKEAIDHFFEKLENGTLNKFYEDRAKDPKKSKNIKEWINKGKIIPEVPRIVFPITPSVLGTVRILSKGYLTAYLKSATAFYRTVGEYKNKFNSFEIQPINILGIQKLKTGKYALLEKVYPAMSIADHLFFSKEELNRYYKSTIRFFGNENSKLTAEHKDKLRIAYNEYKHKFYKTADIAEGNVLVLDYNPGTKKFLFGPIDFVGQSPSQL